MKTKKLFLMAAMLLMSVCTFAQNNNPLKGDVNEDGKVDVADIAAVINIMKNGGGTTDGKLYTTNIPTTTRYSPTQRNYHYILIPSNKTITIVDDSDNAPINITEQTSISIPNHKVYKTNGALNVGGTVRITLS